MSIRHESQMATPDEVKITQNLSKNPSTFIVVRHGALLFEIVQGNPFMSEQSL